MKRQPKWEGVFPAITTAMNQDQSLDLDGLAQHIEILIDSGVTGLVVCGSLGENQALKPWEKLAVVKRAVDVCQGKIPVVSGVAESGTSQAMEYVSAVEAGGVDGIMLMPSMNYKGDSDETMAYFRTIARSTTLPIMIYNNPISYANDITPDMLNQLSDQENFVAIKESSGDTRRITDIHNKVGGRYALFTGVDNLAMEASILGIDGWVAGTGIAFPKENQYFWDLTRSGNWTEALKIYRWFTPLLHLDVHTKFVQYIKLCVQECGLGSEWVRAPRLALSGTEREKILSIIHEGIAQRPKID
ncbi:MAG: dihydrodipicolinate synthase family protein [Verrucomicrobia bacterium]|nr:dihydrodipicolinate synthase family protein [Verrucomicrobiota bacterium]